MTQARTPWIVAIPVVVLAVAFALLVRLPLPFEGFAAAVAAALAALFTFSLTLFLPAKWVWSDEERLVHAFRQRHKVSDDRAESALDAIRTAHRRAAKMRAVSRDFTESLRDRTDATADLLDAAALEVFYDPSSLPAHRANLIRSKLIEEAVDAHAELKRRGKTGTIETQLEQSRGRVAAALDSLDYAFQETEKRLANRLLTDVDVASSTAETLLAPRRATISTQNSTEDT